MENHHCSWENSLLIIVWLVVEPTPLKNMNSLVGITVLFPIYGKMKNVPNHQPVVV